MARTPSTMVPLGTKAPEFSLPNAADGASVSLSDLAHHNALLVMFICNHCPFVIHVRDEISRLENDYPDLGIVGINSNSHESHPQDGPEHMGALVAELGWDFPFLFDATQEVAKAYKAACTPDFFLYDAQQRLAYRGQLDASRPDSGIPVTGEDLRAAIDAVLSGRPASAEQRASLGCNIKWIPGNEPDYYG